nr:hypothetical protein Iba_chr15aCG16120 [Ipomoea batatas]
MAKSAAVVFFLPDFCLDAIATKLLCKTPTISFLSERIGMAISIRPADIHPNPSCMDRIFLGGGSGWVLITLQNNEGL